MAERSISELIQRYEQMLRSGKSVYFDADEFDELAEYYENREDFDTASDVVELGLEMHLGNAMLLLKKGKYLVCTGDYADALAFFNTHFNSYDFDLYLLKIECLLQLDLYAEAYQLTKEILSDEDSDMALALSELGFLYLEADYYNEAILYLDKSLEYAPENIEVLCDLSYAYEMKGDFAASIKVNDRILDIDPYSFDAWVNIGKLHSMQENFDKAIDAFDFALTVSDGDDIVLKLKGHCLLLVGRIEEAIVIFENCIELKPDDLGSYLSLSECYLAQDRYDDLISILEKCEAMGGVSSEIHSKKATAYLQRGDVDVALAEISKGLQKDASSLDLNSIAGDIYFSKDKFEESEACFMKVLEQDPLNVKVLEKIASVHILQNKFTDAISILEKLLEIQEDSSTKRKLALLYFEVGEKEQFIKMLEMLTNDELRSLYLLFFSESQLEKIKMDRQILIQRLTEARECRILFKNLKY